MSYDPGFPPPPPGAPYPASGPPPRRPSPGGNRSLILGLGAGLVALLALTVGAVSWLSPSTPAAGGAPSSTAPATVSASTPSTTSSATAAAPTPPRVPKTSASRKPTTPQKTAAPPKVPDTGLKKNSIYDINLSGSGSCKAKVRRPKPPIKNSKLAPYLRTVVRCVADAFRKPLAREGFTLKTPKVKTFKRSIKTPCGILGSTSNPAFYCNGTIYWPVSSDDGREAYTFARLGYVGLIAHEFGHHLQQTTGMFYDYGPRYADAGRKARLKLSRRLELQAQCFEGVFLSHDRKAIRLSSRDRSELRTWHSYTGDEDPPSSRKPDHGTSRAQVAWLFKGLAGADFGRCNTWSASTGAVR